MIMTKAKPSKPAPAKTKPTPAGVADAISVSGVSQPAKFPTKASKKSQSTRTSSVNPSSADFAKPTEADQRLQKFADNAEPGRSYTLDEIAVQMGVTRERVRQIEQKALMRLYPKLKKVFKDDGISVEDAVSMIQNLRDRGAEEERGRVCL